MNTGGRVPPKYFDPSFPVHNHIRNAQLSAVLKKIIAADEKQTSYSQTYIQGLLMEFFFCSYGGRSI
ncbi:MAG: hypothetical protein IJX14_10575 [Clostridia bacterium]|nr:hypothetical protein [Clostridia bacterium]